MYRDLRYDFTDGSKSGTVESHLIQHYRSLEASSSVTAETLRDEMVRSVAGSSGVDSGEQLLECTVRIRRLLQKHLVKENDPDDGILQDRIKSIKSKVWELQNSSALQNTAGDGGGGRSRCAPVLQLIDDPRRRRQAEIAMEFLPKFGMIQDILNQPLRDIDWQDLRTKLHDVHTLYVSLLSFMCVFVLKKCINF